MGCKNGRPQKPLFSAVVRTDQAGSLAGQAGTSQPYGMSGQPQKPLLNAVFGVVPDPESPRRAALPGKAVRAMFSRIAPKYDLINRILSLGLDKWVRRKAAKLARVRPNDLVLDISTGTAEMALQLARKGASVIGVDFSREMLTLARKKCAHTNIKLIAADAFNLPFRCGPSETGPSGPFDLVTVAFGLRSMGDVKESLNMIKGTLRPGGTVLILEFGMPKNAFIKFFYRIYIRFFVPLIGGLISGKKEAYKYLTRSIITFSQKQNLNEALETSGFQEVHSRPLVSGIAEVYIARKV